MNALRLLFALDASGPERFVTLAVWLGVAGLVLVNAVFVLPGLLREGWAWLRFSLRIPPSRGLARIAEFKARLRIDRRPSSTIVAVSERDRLAVIVHMSDRRGRVRL